YRLLVPLYDHDGQRVHLYARSLVPIAPVSGQRRSYPRVTGLRGVVMANAMAVFLLRQHRFPEQHSWRCVMMAGGAGDYLEWASSIEDDGPAVFGLIPGSWTGQLAGRVPRGCRVIVRA